MNKNSITHTLISIGMPVTMVGFNYVVDAILLLDKPEWKFPKWSGLYHSIGVLNDSTQEIVKKAIERIFETTRNNCTDYDRIEHYLGFQYCDNANSLTQLYKTIKSEEKDEEWQVLKSALLNMGLI